MSNKYLHKQGLNWCVSSLHISKLERPSSCSCLTIPTSRIFEVAFRRFASRFQMTGTIICNNHFRQTLFPRVGKIDFCPPPFQIRRLCSGALGAWQLLLSTSGGAIYAPLVGDQPTDLTEAWLGRQYRDGRFRGAPPRHLASFHVRSRASVSVRLNEEAVFLQCPFRIIQDPSNLCRKSHSQLPNSLTIALY